MEASTKKKEMSGKLFLKNGYKTSTVSSPYEILGYSSLEYIISLYRQEIKRNEIILKHTHPHDG